MRACYEQNDNIAMFSELIKFYQFLVPNLFQIFLKKSKNFCERCVSRGGRHDRDNVSAGDDDKMTGGEGLR